ncbi:MAG: TraR/DksA family transcriptional regulator [Planctomycetota bacterium]|nr:MAG: TraR/DksA family transcriptional regulator [Planctomycetota bacterium]
MKREEFLKQAEVLLRQRRNELRRRVGAGLSELSQGEGGIVRDQADAAAEDEFQLFLCSFADLGKNELAEIEQALEKIRQGTYGVCEACGKNIPIARLEAIPTATMCVHCQQAWEQKRARGWSADGEDDAA